MEAGKNWVGITPELCGPKFRQHFIDMVMAQTKVHISSLRQGDWTLMMEDL
jgi:hypothetical protein